MIPSPQPSDPYHPFNPYFTERGSSPPPRRLARVFEEGSRALVIRVTALHCLRVND